MYKMEGHLEESKSHVVLLLDTPESVYNTRGSERSVGYLFPID